MSNPARRAARTVPLAEYLRAFATQRQNWIVLARNLVPVAGVMLLGWSLTLTAFSYWLDGLAGLGAILAAVVFRGLLESRRVAGTGFLRLAFGGLLVWAILFGLFGIPYWLMLDPSKGVLDLGQLRAQMQESPLTWLSFAALVLGQFWRAFDHGYATLPEDELKRRGAADFGALLTRGVAMGVIARLGGSAWFVPAMALALSYIEIWPNLQATLLQHYKARQQT